MNIRRRLLAAGVITLLLIGGWLAVKIYTASVQADAWNQQNVSKWNF